jgi:hypothetical protein
MFALAMELIAGALRERSGGMRGMSIRQRRQEEILHCKCNVLRLFRLRAA